MNIGELNEYAKSYADTYARNIDCAIRFIAERISDTKDVFHCIPEPLSGHEYHYLQRGNDKLAEFYIRRNDLSIHGLKICGEPVEWPTRPARTIRTEED